MMDKDRLRKADIFSGFAIFCLGIYIISQALDMPMKDSWGGVHNVWYVSPAIFPLFVGIMIALLGALLVRTAVHEAGSAAVKQVISFVFSTEFLAFSRQESNIRFYAVVTVLLSFVFLFVPRVDFFLSAIHFLLVFILFFYLEDLPVLIKLLTWYAGQLLVFLLFTLTPLAGLLTQITPYAGDILMLGFIISFALCAYAQCRHHDHLKRKYRTGIWVAVTTPLFIGICFKYFLLVPMPFEGMVVALLDYIWYL